MIAKIPRWIWIVVAVIVVLAVFQYCRSRGQDKKADADVTQSHVVDSAAKAQAKASARVDTVVDTLWRTAKSHVEAANKLHSQADTAGQHAVTIADSSGMWHLRWQLRGMENDSLRVALKADTTSIMLLTTDRNRWHAVADSAVASQDRLRADLAAARSGCRIIPLVPCLSRKQTAIVGVVTGAVLYARLHR